MSKNNTNNIKNYDAELWEIIEKESVRQEDHIELIASENYASKNVMKIQGSLLTNKYAEGYPGKRYYGGCKYIDEIELLAINRAKKLFNVDYVNVQPHSGSQANLAVYNALLNPGDTVLGMNLTHGGHLTHGAPVNLSGRLYNVITYGIKENGQINYNQLKSLTQKYKPRMIISGFSSYSGLIDWNKMRRIANIVNAYLFVDMAHVSGLVIANLYPNPIPYAHVVTSTTHKTLAGPRGGFILSKCGNEKLYKKLNASVFPGIQGGPLMHVIAAKAAVFKEAMNPSFKDYQKQIIKNAKIMVDVFTNRNFKVISGGTYNHLFILNLTDKNLTGKQAEYILSQANIIVNKNSIPNDTYNSFITSGIRIGTPAVTRRGLVESDVSKLAHWICDALENIENNLLIKDIKNKVLNLCRRYPVYK